MKRRRIALPALAGTALAAALAAGPAAADTVVKVGVINTFSGPTAQQGDMLEKGIQLYYKTHEKDLPPGVKIELIERDDTGAVPDVAKRLAQELITRDHVQIITGVVWSPCLLAIGPIADEAKVPLVDLNAAATVAVKRSQYTVRFSFTLPQQAYPLGKWAAQQGYKNAYTGVSDYAPGHEAAEAFTKAFTESGGKMAGAVTFPAPPNMPDYAPFLQRVRDAKPDVFYVFVPAGASATAIMKTAVDLGLQKSGIHIISTQDLVPDEEIANMGDAIVGLMTSGTYSSFAPRSANKAFVGAFDKMYGTKTRPDFETADAWDGMEAIFQFVRKTKGKFTGEEALDFFRHWKGPESPRGSVMIDPNTRDIVQNVYLREIKKENGKLIDVELKSLGMMDDTGNPVAVK